MKNERLLLRDARCEYLLSLLTRLLSKWLKPCSCQVFQVFQVFHYIKCFASVAFVEPLPEIIMCS